MLAIGIYAQSMTDQQVKEYALRMNEQGVPRQKIYQELVKQGVTQEQMKRVWEQVQRENSQDLGHSSKATSAQMRTRKPNGNSRSTGTMGSMGTMGTVGAIGTISADSLMMDLDSLWPENQPSPKRLIFGHNVFNNENLTFQSSMNLATPQNYVLGPGDEVNIDVWGASQESVTQVISPDGYISVDGVGLIHLSGLTVSQAKKKLKREIGERYTNSNIELTLGQTRTITIHVMGEVKMPGTFTLSAFSTVFNALYMAGGPNEIGTLRNIQVYRQGKLLSNVDVYAFLLSGKLSGDVRLQDNDMITVAPYDALVKISGKVKRPMYYELKEGETVATLLNYAGGFASDAHTRALRVNRMTEPNPTVFSVGEFDYSKFKLMDGDEVSIDAVINRYQNMVEIEGAIFRPGRYQLGGDINTVKALIEAAAGLKENAIATHGVLHRMKFNRTREAMSLNLKGIIEGTSPDVALQNEDILFIASREAINQERTVTIHGEVMSPGVFAYAENETLEDLILQAGGPTKAASLTKIDVSRRIVNPYATNGTDSITTIFTFNLDPEFNLENQTNFVLQPFDEIYVRRSPSYNVQQNVIVEGEVEFAGTYALTNKNTHLSEVINRAGGLTKRAYIEGTKLERQMTAGERDVLRTMIETARRNAGAKDSIDIDKLLTATSYPMAIELEKALKNPCTDDDPILREGDRIIVPRYISSVTVNGEVLYPNTIRYKEGKSAKYYIENAGGYTSSAKKSKTIIIYMNGMVAKASSTHKPKPGCQIVVPSKKKSNPLGIQQWLGIGTTAASIGTMAASIANLLK